MAMEIIGIPVIEMGKPGSNISEVKGQMDCDFFNILAALINPLPIPNAVQPDAALQDAKTVPGTIPRAAAEFQPIGLVIPQPDRAAPQMTAGDLPVLETLPVDEKAVISQDLLGKDLKKESKPEAVLPLQDSMEQINRPIKDAAPIPGSLPPDAGQKVNENRNRTQSVVHPEEIRAAEGAAAAEEMLIIADPGMQVENPQAKQEVKKEGKTALTKSDTTEDLLKPEKEKIPFSHPVQEKRVHESQELKTPPLHGLAKDHVNQDSVKTPEETVHRLPAEKLAVELPGIIETKLTSGAPGHNRTLVIHLEPKELGKLMVKLSNRDGVVTVRIVTDNSETKAIVQNSLTDLRLSFAENGIKYGRLEVELDGQSLQQHQQPQQNQQHQQHQHHNQHQPDWSMGNIQSIPKFWQESYTYSGMEDNPIPDRTLVNQGQVDYTV